jgi:hypothetical protein
VSAEGTHVGSEITFRKDIVFNGRSYTRLDEMPPEVRKLYEQTMESMPRSGADPLVSVRVNRQTRFVVNGREYSSVEDMPPEVRQLYRQAMWRTAPRILGWLTGVLLLAWLAVIVARRLLSTP